MLRLEVVEVRISVLSCRPMCIDETLDEFRFSNCRFIIPILMQCSRTVRIDGIDIANSFLGETLDE